MNHNQALTESQSLLGKARRQLDRSKQCLERSRICIEQSDSAIRESKIVADFFAFSLEDQTDMQRKYVDAICGLTASQSLAP